MMRVRFHILGALEVWFGDQRVPVVGVRHQRVLVFLLLATNQVVPLYRLVEAAWDGKPPATAARQVRKIVASLRQRLPGGPDMIRTEDPGYRMVLAEEQLDLSQFDVGVARAARMDAAAAVIELRAALALWRGPVLSDNGGEVIGSIAKMLDERRFAATERLLQLRLDLGQARDVIDQLRGLVSDYPTRESLRGMLMLALYRAGRQAEALDEYEKLRRRLADELGIDPGRELATLFERILRSSPDLDASLGGPGLSPVAAAMTTLLPQSVPHDLPDFVGRSTELSRLLDIVQRPDGSPLRMVSITGMGGVGKTSFAVHAAHRLTPRYPDGQLFIDLHGFSVGQRPTGPAEALDVLLTSIGIPADQIPHRVEGKVALWRTALADRRMLIVLDNVGNSEQVLPLLPAKCCCLVLITSRLSLTGLDGAVPLSLDLLSEDDGLNLLAGTLGRHRLDAEHDAAVDLVRRCGRLPLALRIAAARLRHRPWRSIRHLAEKLRDADGRFGELVAENRSVAATLELSYEAMPPDAQSFFCLLGSMPGCVFDAYAAAALTGRPLARTEELLDELLDAHLLGYADHTGCACGTGYALHDLVRDCARRMAGGVPDPRAQERVIDYYLRVAGVAAGVLGSGRPLRSVVGIPDHPIDMPLINDTESALHWFEAERLNLMAAVVAAERDGYSTQAKRLAGHLESFLDQYAHQDDEELNAL